MITVFYFASLRETLGVGTEEIALPTDVRNLDGLRAVLAARGDAWTRALAQNKAIRVAVNQELASGDAAIADGDEIAFFPPVTGG